MENLYLQVIHDLREYINSKRNSSEIEDANIFMKNIRNRIRYLTHDGNSKVLEKRLIKEVRKFSKSVFRKINNDGLYKDTLQKNIDRVAWINLKYKIDTSGRYYTVAQREIFYANLGNNIGSEQNGRRPVIILQNNTANRKGNTTIIAPITTHQKSKLRYDEEKHAYFIGRKEDGIVVEKRLGKYEVPLKLEGEDNKLFGFINIMHIREIDRKRIDSAKVGMATEDCFRQVIKAIRNNFHT